MNAVKTSSKSLRFLLQIVLALLAFQLPAKIAAAHVVRVVIQRVESPTFGGTSFGSVGQYEKIVGVAYGEVDPSDPHNAIIQDIALAPRNSRGMVEYSTDVYILRPLDPKKGNEVLFYDVVNRGNKLALAGYNVGGTSSNDPSDTTAAAGDGFLMNQGYTIIWTGWQGDVLPGNSRMGMHVPTLMLGWSGEVLSAMVDSELVVNKRENTLNLSSGSFTGLNTESYPAASLDTTKATLTRRMHEKDAGEPLSPSDWAFADCSVKPFPGVPSETQVCVKGGFDPNYLYDLQYEAMEPKVLGLGFAATRDFISYLRHDDDGLQLIGFKRGVSEPHAAIMYGASQSGRYVRSYLDLGFNADEKNQIVFEGMIPHLATGRIPLNVRWGQPGRATGQHVDHLYPIAELPDTWETEQDPVEGVATGSILDHCKESKTCPKVMQEVTGTEYWQGRMSLDTTDPMGKNDLAIPANVRIYFLSSTEHGPAATPSKGICQQLSNPAPYRETLRALLTGMTEWVVHDQKPPESRYPTIKDGTLVKSEDTGFPKIPGVNYTGLYNYYQLLDFGNAFKPLLESGIVAPAKKVAGANYVVLVPKTDPDGNDIAGVRSTTIQAPVATYTGWNLRAAGFAENELCGLSGSYIPFAAHKADRVASGDPRLSLEERYHSHAGYVSAVTAAANDLVSQGYLLPEDARRLISEAQASNIAQ